MKLVFFIGGLTRGGAERVISILANHYCKENEVEIALLLENSVDYEVSENIKIVDLTCKSNSYIVNLPLWLTKIRRYINSSNPDRIISFVGRINMLVLVATLGMGIPVIVSERNDPKRDGRSRLSIALCNELYKHSHIVVFQNSYQKNCFKSDMFSSVIIPNPVIINTKNKVTRVNTLICVGRLNPQKNHVMAIKAMKTIKEQVPDIKLCIYGEGPLEEKLVSLISQLQLEQNVRLCGNVADVQNRMSEASLFVLTSDYEGMPNALLEALAIGLPCISTNFDGVEDLIDDGYNGYVVEKNDHVQCAQRIVKVLSSKELREQMSLHAELSGKRFLIDNVINLWDRVILE